MVTDRKDMPVSQMLVVSFEKAEEELVTEILFGKQFEKKLSVRDALPAEQKGRAVAVETFMIEPQVRPLQKAGLHYFSKSEKVTINQTELQNFLQSRQEERRRRT